MLAQIGIDLIFRCHYIETKVSKTGLTVTVDVYRNDVEIVTGASATEVGDGLYKYTLAAASNNAEGDYIAVFKTATTSVDQQHLPAMWTVRKIAANVKQINDVNLTGDGSATPWGPA